ncbi:MAG: hypothetical protein ACLP0J_25250 [Solirubrobacteraceae bacterium]
MKPAAAVILGVAALALPAALAASASAAARPRVFVPPGNSATSQYIEVVPTVSGSRPTSSIHATPGGGSTGGGSTGGGGSSSTGSGGSGSSGSSSGSGGSPISQSTQRRLDSLGTNGRAAAALAHATAPSTSGAQRLELTSNVGGSPAGELLKAVAGSSGGGGISGLMPVILIGSLVGAVVLTLLRRRGTT